MDTKELTAILVVAMIGCVIVAGFIPVVGESVSATTTFENEGIYYMTNPAESMHVEYTGGTSWVIDDEPLNYTSIGATNIVVFDNSFIRNNGQIRGTVNTGWDNADVVIGNGTITGTANDGAVTVNYTYDTVYIATNDKSSWIMTKPTNTTYIKGDSELIGMGLTGVKDGLNVDHYITCYVTVNDLEATVTTNSTSVTISDIVLNTVAVNGYIGLYEFNSVTFKATWTDTNGTAITDCTYNILIAPSTVTAEKAIHADANTASIVSMIPFILIMGIVLMFVGVVIVRRYV